MVTAAPFPDPWGWDQLLGSNNTMNLVNATVDVYRESGQDGIVMAFAFGAIPLMLATMIYIRYENVGGALLILLFSNIGLHAFGLLTPDFAAINYTIAGLALGIAFVYPFFKKG
jgi:hypothetical protein